MTVRNKEKNLKKMVFPTDLSQYDSDLVRECQNVTFYGKEGDYAQEIAEHYGYPFVAK